MLAMTNFDEIGVAFWIWLLVVYAPRTEVCYRRCQQIPFSFYSCLAGALPSGTGNKHKGGVPAGALHARA